MLYILNERIDDLLSKRRSNWKFHRVVSAVLGRSEILETFLNTGGTYLFKGLPR